MFVSGGPNQVSIPPTVINDEVDVARSLLESAEYGLKVEIQQQVDPVIPAGVVISTNPPPNTLVDKGSTVTLIVSSGPGQERVPPLVGLTEGQSRNLLDDRGFGIEVTYRELPPGDPRDGTVLEQSIPTSQMVDKGTVVVVVVGQARVAETTTTTSTTTTTTIINHDAAATNDTAADAASNRGISVRQSPDRRLSATRRFPQKLRSRSTAAGEDALRVECTPSMPATQTHTHHDAVGGAPSPPGSRDRRRVETSEWQGSRQRRRQPANTPPA